LLPCNTYSTLSPTHRHAAVERFRHHLSPGGVFATSLPNPELLHNSPLHGQTLIEDIFPHPHDGEPVQVSNTWQRTRRHFVIDWHYDHLLPDGTVQRTSIQIKHFLTTTAEYISELRDSGFKSIDLFGEFDLSSFRSDSPHLIIIAS
jgi:hypothetical protein